MQGKLYGRATPNLQDTFFLFLVGDKTNLQDT